MNQKVCKPERNQCKSIKVCNWKSEGRTFDKNGNVKKEIKRGNKKNCKGENFEKKSSKKEKKKQNKQFEKSLIGLHVMLVDCPNDSSSNVKRNLICLSLLILLNSGLKASLMNQVK